MESDGETAAEVLTDYYNDLEKQAKEIREQLNNYFLYKIMESMTDTAYPFWETDGAVLDGFEEACVSVQFSDGWDCEYYCGAYEKFEPGFIPTDWHNF